MNLFYWHAYIGMVKRNLHKCHKIKCLLYFIPGICIEQKTSPANSLQFFYKTKACLPKFENGNKIKMKLKNIYILESLWIGIMFSGTFTTSVDEERLKSNSDSSFLLGSKPPSPHLSRNSICYFSLISCYTHPPERVNSILNFEL